MENEERPGFKRVRLTGARFEGGRLPVDSLTELQKYQDIVRIAAEAEWRQEHPEEDVPQDLHSSVSLTIDRINKGSADLLLAFEEQTYDQYQVDGQNMVDLFIVAAYSNTEIPELQALTPYEAYKFRAIVAQLGSTLSSDQTIEYYPNAPESAPVVISVESHKLAHENLLSAEDFLLVPETEVEETGLQKFNESLIGKVTALDTDKMTYRFTLQDGQQLTGHYKRQVKILDDLREVVNEAAEGPLTKISGELQTKNDELFRFWHTFSVEQVQFDNTVWGQRLTEFASLRRDWDEAGAEQISSVALDAAQAILRTLDEANIERPGVFPTPDGGVLLEWGSTDSVVSVELLDDGSFETFSLAAGQDRGEHSTGENLELAIDFVVKAAKSD